MKKILFIIAVFFAVAPTAQAGLSRAPNNLGLVGYWPMNDARGTRAGDMSGQGNHGTLTGGPTWGAGKLGYGLNLDGINDYVAVGTGLGKPTSYTISAWIKPSAFGNASIASARSDGADATIWGFLFRDAGDAVEIWTSNGTSGQQFVTASDWNATGFPSSVWTHVSATVDGSTIRYYKNGSLVSSTSQTVSQAGTVHNFSIGRPGDYTGYFSGSLDEVRIYNRALGAAEVARLYAAGQSKSTASNSNGLVAHWSFTDCKGLRATDFSGQGNHGTLTGGPTWGTGRLGCGLTFDGSDDRIDLGLPSALDLSGQMTISAWIKRTVIGAGTQSIVVNYQSGSTGRYFFELNRTTNKLGWLNNGGIVAATSTGEISDTNWHHVVGVRSGSTGNWTITFYIDGAAAGTTSGVTSDPGTYSGAVVVGMAGALGINFFNGSMDDIRIYNRALSAAEVSSLYASGVAGIDPGVAKVNSTQKNLLTNGLVGYWGFNGADTTWSSATAGTTRDLSGNSNTGTMTNMSQRTSPVAGKSGQALSFDGVNDYVDAGDSSSLSPASAVTMATWFKKSASNSKIEFGKGAVSPTASYYMEVYSDGNIYFYVSGNGTTTAYKVAAIAQDTNWHHLVGVYNGTTLTLYLDGVDVGGSTVGAVPASLFDSTTPFTIGTGEQGGYVHRTTGIMDEVRVYNRALSAAEVKELYNLAR